MKNSLDGAVRQQEKERDFLLGRYSVPRDAEDTLKKSLDSSLIKVITGPRRAGKSTLAMQCLRGKKFGYLNFEDNSLPLDIDTNALMSVVDSIYGDPKLLLFDEIQVLPRWEQFLNTLHRRGRNIIVTGSNSRLLSGELASSLTGRHHSIELLPLSYKEFAAHPWHFGVPPLEQWLHESAPLSAVFLKTFNRYWTTGGFPEVSVGSEEVRG